MTVSKLPITSNSWIAAMRQLLVVIITNIPTAMFGVSLAWVSSAAGSRAAESRGAVASGAGATHVASAVGVLMAATSLRWGRKPALVGASAAFVACWALKLTGGALPLLGARICAGLAGAAAWVSAPLLARELTAPGVRGAASAAPVLAHNLGFLLMYVAADSGLSSDVILWGLLAVSVAHCFAMLAVPESPAYLAAAGRLDEARSTLTWVLAANKDSTAVEDQMRSLPPKEDALPSPLAQIRELCSDSKRRKALALVVAAVAGQEICGLLALLQFAEPVLEQAGGNASSYAVVLGSVQLVASAAALYLVDRVGRKPLISWTALVCAGALTAGAVVAGVGGGAGGGVALAAALAVAVTADSLGMQPAPYALLADMFHYRHRGAALWISLLCASAGNAIETGAVALAGAVGGPAAAVGLAAVATTLYAIFAFVALPKYVPVLQENTRPSEKSDSKTIVRDRAANLNLDDCEKQSEWTRI